MHKEDECYWKGIFFGKRDHGILEIHAGYENNVDVS